MEGPKLKQKGGKTVRFRVASANSGRVLTEVFKDEAAWCGSVLDSVDSECTSSPEAEQGSPPPPSKANSHLNGLEVETSVDENGFEPDELLVYASAKREMLFSNKRINICSKNGTVRGVRNKVSAGQVLFNNLSNMYAVSEGIHLKLLFDSTVCSVQDDYNHKGLGACSVMCFDMYSSDSLFL